MREQSNGEPRAARVLVAEDDRRARDAVAEALGEAGYEVAVAANGLDAVAMMLSFAPDLLLTDMHMPGLDGLGVLRLARAHRPCMPVVIVTAEPQEATRAAAERLGVTDYLSKPIDLDAMFRCIERALERAGMTNTGGCDDKTEGS